MFLTQVLHGKIQSLPSLSYKLWSHNTQFQGTGGRKCSGFLPEGYWVACIQAFLQARSYLRFYGLSIGYWTQKQAKYRILWWWEIDYTLLKCDFDTSVLNKNVRHYTLYSSWFHKLLRSQAYTVRALWRAKRNVLSQWKLVGKLIPWEKPKSSVTGKAQCIISMESWLASLYRERSQRALWLAKPNVSSQWKVGWQAYTVLDIVSIYLDIARYG